MNPFDLFITQISWGSGRKSRPVLVIQININNVLVYPITSQYENKSKTIQSNYFKINDWSAAGLNKQSYVDTGILIELPLIVIDKRQPIGKLTITDKQRFLDFINEKNETLGQH